MNYFLTFTPTGRLVVKPSFDADPLAAELGPGISAYFLTGAEPDADLLAQLDAYNESGTDVRTVADIHAIVKPDDELYCSSSVDFAHEYTDDAGLIRLCREIRIDDWARVGVAPPWTVASEPEPRDDDSVPHAAALEGTRTARGEPTVPSTDNNDTHSPTASDTATRPSRYRVTLTLMGGSRVETKVFEATDEDAALDMAAADGLDGWEIADESWKDSDVEVTEIE
jgi:hypothetical protein